MRRWWAQNAENREPSPRFMESIHAAMQALGVAKDHFREEAFG